MRKRILIAFWALIAAMILFPAVSKASLVSGAAWNIVGCADFNLDGTPDILWRNQTTGEVVVWFTANGRVVEEQKILTVSDTNMNIVAVGDMDGDGRADILWQNSSTGEIILYKMNGWIKTEEYVIGTAPASSRIMGIGDFGGGTADILWRNTSTGEVFVWLMDGALPPAVTATQSITTVVMEWQIVAVGDFNGDSSPDILWRHTTDGEGVIWFMSGTTPVSAHTSFSVPMLWSVVGVGDFDQDQKNDILWYNPSSQTVVVWMMDNTGNATGCQTYATTYDPNWVILGTGYFNTDGTQDILWENRSTGELVIWFMNGSTLAYADYVTNVPNGWQIVGIGDMNGDGISDLIWANTTTGEVDVWYMREAMATGASVIVQSLPTQWRITGVGDVNGDGYCDLVWRNVATGEVVIWFMNGASAVSAVSVVTVNMSWTIIGLADFDGDGNADLVWRNGATGDIVIWYMNSNGTASSAGDLGITIPAQWTVVGVGDFTLFGDGKPDLLWRDSSTGDVAIWYMNNISPVSAESLWLECADPRS